MSLKWKCFTPQRGRYLHPFATTDRPVCQQTGFYLLLRDLEIKRYIHKIKTCKHTNKWTAERKYGMTKGAFAVLSSSPRSRLIYTLRSVSAICWSRPNSLKKRSLYTLRTPATEVLSRKPRMKYPVRKPQYPNTNSPDWSIYISLKDWSRESVCTSKLLTSDDHSINSHQSFSRLCIQC